MKVIDETIARKQVVRFIDEMNGKEHDKPTFYFLCLLVIANALIYIGDCICNLNKDG